MLKLNKHEKLIYSHIIEKQQEINKLCESNKNKSVCCLIHTKFIRDIDGNLKEIYYMCEKQKQQYQIMGKLKVFKSPINFESSKTGFRINFRDKKVKDCSIENTKATIQLIKENIKKQNETTIGYIDLPFLFNTELANTLELNFQLLEKLKNVDILIIDNLGAESKNKYLLENYICEVLRTRNLNDRKTFILKEPDFENIYLYEKHYEKTFIDRLKKLMYNK